MSFPVHHAVGTARHRPQDECGCPSWVEHWRRNTGSRRANCVVIGCPRRVEVGAHVYLRTGGKLYIVGMCSPCNLSFRGQRFQIDERTWITEARYLETCVGFGEDDE